MHSRLLPFYLTVLATLCGCPGTKPGNIKLSGSKKAATVATSPQTAAQYALFDPQTQLGSIPVAWSLSSDGTRLLGLVSTPDSGEVFSWDLTGPAVGEPDSLGKQPSLRAYVVANHDGSQALAAALENTPDGAIDVYWLLRGAGSEAQRLDYAHAAGLPGKLPPASLEGNSPIFSGDGQQVIIPVKTLGLILLPLSGAGASFVPLPSFGDATPQSVTLSLLPPLNGKQYLAASLAAFESMGGTDYCQLQFLDLSTRHWEDVSRFNTWLPLVVGCPDFHSQPWVLLGSRKRDTVEEPMRVAKLGLFDPKERLPLLIPYLNDVELDDLARFKLDMTGEHLICLDHIRQAVVRYRPRDGQLEIDPRVYLPQGQFLTSRDSEVVLLVQDNVVMRVEFSQTEEMPGYAEDAAPAS